ncbi:biotin--[acetyl-CoA-carboxylase] ligase [Salinimicrobium marinum]|uniref:Biotin--[acetyl-CoA-carboxylase] ligase n=1 Tax=Salinimicrobium marinum TaxID=680283 RepID=A0A918W014_9FLAO|nr:biotin--[acetyl-CoA-carboxylase] ligase [Salinimicrobium marinum]GHA49146.1 biotin--[acetyl-CoA-carboxylase] ligase [Salinimicrobium marinum]
MHLIKVNAIKSTNSFAREMFKEKPAVTATCIVAKEQLEGRGQRGTSWMANPGQNLTFSILWPKPDVTPGHQFLLSAVVATAIVESLQKFSVPRLKVKWPNDIMAANQKLCGILIENVISDGKLAASVIGVGLNVNQTDFGGLPTAGSMKLLTGHNFDLDEVLEGVLKSIEDGLSAMKHLQDEDIMKVYRRQLFRLGVPSTFQLPDLTMFTGIIEDVSESGKLLVKTENETIKEFELKEIKLCF